MVCTNPFPTASITKLISTFACHVVTCLGFLNYYSALITLCEVVFHVEDQGLIFCAFTLVLEIHAFFTKLILALKTLIRLVIDNRNDPMAILIGTHFQERIIRNEIKLLHLIKKQSGFLIKRPKESSLLVNICQTRLFRTLGHNKAIEFSVDVLLEANAARRMLAKTEPHNARLTELVQTYYTLHLLLHQIVLDVTYDGWGWGGFAGLCLCPCGLGLYGKRLLWWWWV